MRRRVWEPWKRKEEKMKSLKRSDRNNYRGDMLKHVTEEIKKMRVKRSWKRYPYVSSKDFNTHNANMTFLRFIRSSKAF